MAQRPLTIEETGRITIAGAGLAGALLATLLAQQGFRIRLLERHPDPRSHATRSGRSINLALAERGRQALRLAGLLEQVDRFTLPMRGRMMHSEWGELTAQAYGASEDDVIWSTHRSDLNNLLLDAAEATGRVDTRFSREVAAVDWDTNRLVFKDGTNEHFEVLLGADGAGSSIRRAMQEDGNIHVSEELLDHGYLELELPPGPDGDFSLAPDYLHIWPRGGFMLIALPNQDRSFTGTLFLPREGDVSFSRLGNWTLQKDFCELHFPDALPLMPELRRDFARNPVGLLGTIRCAQWHHQDKALLLGDAAHAIVPFHGQGMNAAFEDCVVLAQMLRRRAASWGSVFTRFQRERIAQANAIADMALENYAVMRLSVRDPVFLLRKKLEHELERRHGDRFVPRYSQVMFHCGPYAEAYERGDIQAEILDQLLEGAGSLEEVDFKKAARLITGRLRPIERRKA